jgi:TATA-box binding protein (TBP) (component of TFIID and TFIIIB)
MQGDPEGGMDVSDIVEKIEVEDHLDLKKIADEIGDVYYEDVNITGKLKRPKKASGGLAHLLGE